VLILTFGSIILLFSRYKGSFLSLGIKQPGHIAEHSTSSSANIRNAKNYTFTPPYAFKALSLLKPLKQQKQKNMTPMFIPEQ
jgi:hypothetical protein